jgi:2-polyprenyl-3-methyl-5-hydroxy-6-metoxy-1,4-benzoquinol methylase
METLDKRQMDYKQLWEDTHSKKENSGGKYNFLAVGDTSLGYGFNHWMYAERRIIFKRETGFLKTGLNKKHILDIGAGTGFYIDIWEEAGAKDISGCDITEFAIKFLTSKYPSHNFYRLDIGEETNVFQKEQFDIISAMDVLFHITDDDRFFQALKNINSFLKKGGYFIMSDNFPEKEQRHWKHTIRSKALIMNLVERAGYKVEKLVPLTVLLNGPADEDKFCIFMWNLTIKILYRYKSKKYKNIAGYMLGFFYFFMDKIALKLMSPHSNQLLICRKV